MLDFAHMEHSAGLGLRGEWGQELGLLLGVQMLMVPATTTTQVEQCLSFLGPSRMDDVHGGC